MDVTSKTGLLASPTKRLKKIVKNHRQISLKAVTKPAPYALKPFAGLYNPYPYGCSLLCNHPTDNEAKELLKKARETWVLEGKNFLLAEEIEAIKANFEQLCSENTNKKVKDTLDLDSVPEELFRRYTETDSRPLTPAPTLASGHTRASGSRRCVTPDPVPLSEVREKTKLILDLRRSHSQETLSWYGAESHDTPLLKTTHLPARAGSYSHAPDSPKKKPEKRVGSSSPKRPKTYEKTGLDSAGDKKENKEENEDGFKRRGKRRKKRGRDLSGGRSAFQSTADPETQVAAFGGDSHDPSARPSLIPPTADETKEQGRTGRKIIKDSWECDSYLDAEILRQLRRELNEEVVENEFNFKRRKALEEALKTIPSQKIECEELVALRKELNVPIVNTEFVLSLPRAFTRSSARFELPMDSRTFNTLTPVEYVKDNVSITSPRKLLYNCIFNKCKAEFCDEDDKRKTLPGKGVLKALNLIMGKNLTEEQAKDFKELLGWEEEEEIDFKTFCGVCALCERLLAKEFVKELPDRKKDPCHEIETADFESLPRRLEGQNADPRLVKILYAIKDL